MLIEVESEDAVRKAAPDLAALAQVRARGFILTARAKESSLDFVSRYFAPGIGVNEDPVTGSAHCALAPYWSAKLDKTSPRAAQLSKRGGTLELELDETRVRIGGRAVTVFTGALAV